MAMSCLLHHNLTWKIIVAIKMLMRLKFKASFQQSEGFNMLNIKYTGVEFPHQIEKNMLQPKWLHCKTVALWSSL